jgi:hypothetical protein
MRLSREQYKKIANNIKTMREIYWDTFLIINGKFPKNEKTMRSMWDLERNLSRTYYQLEREFFKDFPEAKQSDYRGGEADGRFSSTEETGQTS